MSDVLAAVLTWGAAALCVVVIGVAAIGTCLPARADPERLCPPLARLLRLEERDGDVNRRYGFVQAVMAALPNRYRGDAAVFYFPYGGDIPDGTDTSGIATEDAGERLYNLYRRTCGEAMFPQPPDDPGDEPIPACGIDGLDDRQGVCVERPTP